MEIELTAKNCDDDCTIVARSVLMTHQNYTFSKKLEACGIYEYKLTNGGELNYFDEFSAKEQFEKVEGTHLEQLDSVTLRASWNETTKFLLCEKKFRIIFRQSNQENPVLTSETSSLYQNSNVLEPCEDYVVSIYPMAMTLEGESMLEYGESVNHIMDTVLPTGIRDLAVTYDKSDNTIKIDWQKPENGSRCVKAYEVTIESEVDNRTRTSNVTFESFNNVCACIDYVIRINSWTINDMRAAEVMKEIAIPSRGD